MILGPRALKCSHGCGCFQEFLGDSIVDKDGHAVTGECLRQRSSTTTTIPAAPVKSLSLDHLTVDDWMSLLRSIRIPSGHERDVFDVRQRVTAPERNNSGAAMAAIHEADPFANARAVAAIIAVQETLLEHEDVAVDAQRVDAEAVPGQLVVAGEALSIALTTLALHEGATAFAAMVNDFKNKRPADVRIPYRDEHGVLRQKAWIWAFLSERFLHTADLQQHSAKRALPLLDLLMRPKAWDSRVNFLTIKARLGVLNMAAHFNIEAQAYLIDYKTFLTDKFVDHYNSVVVKSATAARAPLDPRTGKRPRLEKSQRTAVPSPTVRTDDTPAASTQPASFPRAPTLCPACGKPNPRPQFPTCSDCFRLHRRK